MNEAPLIYQEEGGIGYLILNSPPKNEMDSAFFFSLSKIKKEVLSKVSIKGLIIHGSGRHFSSGANVDELKKIIMKDDKAHLQENLNSIMSINTLSFPVVAAIGGSCFGSALELALACHFRVAATHAVFGFPEATFNLMPGLGSTYLLPKIVGKAKAIELLLSAKSFLADEAYEYGLIDFIVDKNEIITKAKQIIEKVNHLNGLN